MKVFRLSLFLIFLLTSCNDEMETDAQLTAKKLKADIGWKTIDTISVTSIYDGAPIFQGTTYSITSDGFMVVRANTNSATFNLGEMKSYRILDNFLILYY
jgi:hypothetical protein